MNRVSLLLRRLPSVGELLDAMQAAATVLLAHVHETLMSDRSVQADDLATMNQHMLRDIGAEGVYRPRMAMLEMQLPRL